MFITRFGAKVEMAPNQCRVLKNGGQVREVWKRILKAKVGWENISPVSMYL